MEAKLAMWTAGETGFPFCDCFMRELAATGYTTHCGRECVAWLLVRDLQLDWRLGAEYFESILIDYEPTANWGNWAYRIATTAATQKFQGMDGSEMQVEGRNSSAVATTSSIEMLMWAQKHDPAAVHVKLWLPELASLPAALALEPWRLTRIPGGGAQYGFEYGVAYPMPCVRPLAIKRNGDEEVWQGGSQDPTGLRSDHYKKDAISGGTKPSSESSTEQRQVPQPKAAANPAAAVEKRHKAKSKRSDRKQSRLQH